jgi:hypothetical protein
MPTTPVLSSASSSLESWKSPKITSPTSIAVPISAPDPSSLGIAARKTPIVTKTTESISYREELEDDGDNDDDKYQKKSLTQLLVALGFM